MFEVVAAVYIRCNARSCRRSRISNIANDVTSLKSGKLQAENRIRLSGLDASCSGVGRPPRFLIYYT